MEEKEFIVKFASIFDEVEAQDLNVDTAFREIDEWSSLNALMLLAVVEGEYGIKLNNRDMENANTIGDLFEIIKEKQK